jgi:hypothetical protein
MEMSGAGSKISETLFSSCIKISPKKFIAKILNSSTTIKNFAAKKRSAVTVGPVMNNTHQIITVFYRVPEKLYGI